MKRIFVHRFKWSHDKRRREMKRRLKDGSAKVIERNKDGWLYEVVDPQRCPNTDELFGE